MDQQPDSTPLTLIAPRDPRPFRLVTILAVAVAVAVVKPWAPEPATRPSPPIAAAVPSRAPAPRPIVADPQADLRRHCHEPSGWRVYAHQTWTRGFIRTWQSLEPAVAWANPLDDGLPTILVPESVTALGYCAPWQGAERPPEDARLSVWLIRSIPPAGGAVVSLHQLAPRTDTSLGGLFTPSRGAGAERPPSTGVGSPDGGTWTANRYVFALRAEGWERWWEVRVGPPPARVG